MLGFILDWCVQVTEDLTQVMFIIKVQVLDYFSDGEIKMFYLCVTRPL